MAYSQSFNTNFGYTTYHNQMPQNVFGTPQQQQMVYQTPPLSPGQYATTSSWPPGDMDLDSTMDFSNVDCQVYGTQGYNYSNRGSDTSSPVQAASPRSDTSSQSGVRYFYCPEPACEPQYRSKRKADVTRHIINKHTNDPQFDCLLVNCSRKGKSGFNMEYHRNEHMRKSHNIELVPSEGKRQKAQRARSQPKTTARRQVGDKVYEGQACYFPS